MTTGTHGYVPVSATMVASAALMGAACPGIAILGFLCGLPMAYSAMLPDFIGIWGGSLHGKWEQYVRAHHGDIGKVRACMSIGYKAHLRMDALTHPGPNMEPPPLNKKWQSILLEVAVIGVCAGGLALTYGIWTAILAYAAVWSLPGLCVGVSYLSSPHYERHA